jgi:hypothetical protein
MIAVTRRHLVTRLADLEDVQTLSRETGAEVFTTLAKAMAKLPDLTDFETLLTALEEQFGERRQHSIPDRILEIIAR